MTLQERAADVRAVLTNAGALAPKDE